MPRSLMRAFSFAFAVPLAKWLGLKGTKVGMMGTQILFQGMVGAALSVESKRMRLE